MRLTQVTYAGDLRRLTTCQRVLEAAVGHGVSQPIQQRNKSGNLQSKLAASQIILPLQLKAA